MKRYYIFSIISCLAFFTKCNSEVKHENKSTIKISETTKKAISSDSTLSDAVQKISLPNNFELRVGEEEDFGDFKTYTFLQLLRFGKPIYSDSTKEYEFGNKLYPLVKQLSPNTFELLFEINDRPSKNKLRYLRVKDNKVLEEKELPTFISKAKNLDHDELSESAGFWDYAQEGGSSKGDYGLITAYNPIIYFEWTKAGLQIDTALTKSKNAEIYGAFKGYEFNEKIEIPVKQFQGFSKEIERIENL